VVIGAGKTGMDAALFLLERGVDQERITWIVSNDAWFFNRAITVPEYTSTQLSAQFIVTICA
jgi:hypothetical protein